MQVYVCSSCITQIDMYQYIFNLQLISLALLICAAVSVSYVNKVGSDVYGFDTAGSRGVAGWTLSVSCVCCFYHSYAFYILARCREFDMEKHNTIYSITVSQCIAIMYVILVHKVSIVDFSREKIFTNFTNK